MNCIFTPLYIAIISTNVAEVAITLISLISAITNINLDGSIRGIMISFSIANLIGASMFTFDTLSFVCYQGAEHFDFTVIVTSVLSLSHIMLLVLDYYIIFTANSNRKAWDFTGLIFTAWIVAAALGSMNWATKQFEAQMAIVAIFILVVVFIYNKYFLVVRKHHEFLKLEVTYKAFLNLEGVEPATSNHWHLTYVVQMLTMYVVCTVPWVIYEIRAGVSSKRDSLVHSASALVYTLFFFCPSALCIYMRYKMQTAVVKDDPKPNFTLRQKYSLRFTNR